jgi:2-dehydro-3-deoxy-D-arabinonate dehydratase
VPEPELALAIDNTGQVIGYSIGNDMSSRDIEGENPLYLPQAKIYDGSCAIGPALLLSNEPFSPETPIRITIMRAGATVFEGGTILSQMKRSPAELASWLFRETSYPNGCYLLTGTGVIPPPEFSLVIGDEISITIPPIGTLINTVTS